MPSVTMSYKSVPVSSSQRGDEAADPSRRTNGDASESGVGAGENSEQPVSDDTDSNASIWEKTKAFYHHNIGLFFVFLSQLCASIMAMTTRLLETGFDTKLHAFQVIFVRMTVTAILGSLYLWYKKVPDFPFGPPGVRLLLVLRGFAGTVGLFGLYYSLSFLDIADSTVITFLVPTLTAFVCWVALKEPFTVREGIAGVIAFAGVLFIARPNIIFSHLPWHSDDNDNANPSMEASGSVHITDGIFDPPVATPAERSLAVVCAVIGSFAAATAYATIRIIGTRVHSLVSVNYFAISATVTSFLVLLIHPGLSFQAPQGTAQWLLLASIGLSGFLLQVLLTEGLQRERAGRATNMMYTQLVCALVIERIVWGTTPPFESFVGAALIISAAVWVGLQKKAAATNAKKNSAPDEETSLLRPNED